MSWTFQTIYHHKHFTSNWSLAIEDKWCVCYNHWPLMSRRVQRLSLLCLYCEQNYIWCNIIYYSLVPILRSIDCLGYWISPWCWIKYALLLTYLLLPLAASCMPSAFWWKSNTETRFFIQEWVIFKFTTYYVLSYGYFLQYPVGIVMQKITLS